MSNLFQWAKKNNIEIKKIQLNFLSSGYDLAKAENKITKGENILTIPKDLILTSLNPTIKGVCESIKKIPELAKDSDLICLSLSLKNLLSQKWKQYSNYLFDSVKFTNFPLFYNQEEMNLLKGSYFNTLLSATRNQYKLEYTILKKKNFFKSKSFSEEEYIKSRIIINSKFVNLNLNNKKISGLVPIIDVFTSQNLKSNCELSIKNGTVHLNAKENINKKEKIKLSIGKYSNYHLLINYGITSDNNPAPLDVYLDLKIKNQSGHKRNEELFLSNDFDLNNLMKKLRKIVYKLSDKKKTKKTFDNPKNLVNELESLRVFKGGLNSQLSKFPSHLSDDVQKMSNNKNFNELNILNVLVHEKKVKFIICLFII